MRRLLLLGVVLAACLTAPAGAQHNPEAALEMQARLNAPPDPNLAPVETLSCEQMMAEMTLAGQQMNAQMDPNLGADIQAMQDESQSRMREAQVGILTGGLICAVPGLGMACTAMVQAQAANQMAHADEDQQRMDAIMGSMTDATAGMDMQRMQALSERIESEHCPMPEAPAE